MAPASHFGTGGDAAARAYKRRAHRLTAGSSSLFTILLSLFLSTPPHRICHGDRTTDDTADRARRVLGTGLHPRRQGIARRSRITFEIFRDLRPMQRQIDQGFDQGVSNRNVEGSAVGKGLHGTRLMGTNGSCVGSRFTSTMNLKMMI